MARTPVPPHIRFWKHVDRSGPCWLWRAKTNSKGYGIFTITDHPLPRVTSYAHRFSYELHNGAIPDALCILHECDTPACVNPSHLRLGTRRDNNVDMWSKRRGRILHPQGEAHGRAKLSEAEARLILHRHAAGESGRSLAREYGVDKSTVLRVLRGQSWKHLHQGATGD